MSKRSTFLNKVRSEIEHIIDDLIAEYSEILALPTQRTTEANIFT